MSATETTLTKLEGNEATKQAGSFVLSGQTLATDDGFGHVSKIWFDKTMTYEQGLEQIEKGRAATEDILATVGEMIPGTDKDGNFVFNYKDGRSFKPTAHAVRQAGNWADTGTWYVENMLVNPTDVKGREKYKRDAQDSETLATVFRNGFRRLDQRKSFLWRTSKDGTLRAMLTDRYAMVDNRWFVEKLREFVPGGRLSHWRGDSDTLFGNVLIPDTIREDKDSDYGGMLSVGNSEIGVRRVSSMPSIFRAICMNGCIWGQTKGKGIKQVHRGTIVLEHLALEIKKNLQEQIPLLPQGIDKLLGLRTMGWDGAKTSVKPVFAAIVKGNAISKKQATEVLKAWHTEKDITPGLEYTLFSVANAFTRAGQTLDNDNWVKFDEIGGELLTYGQDEFTRLLSKANGLSVKEVDEVFSNAA